jgi:hypothetical protein
VDLAVLNEIKDWIVTLSAIAVGIWLAFRVLMMLRMGSIESNVNAIEQWFKKLDVIVDNQRYLGERATPMVTFAHGRQGLGGYMVHSLFETPSGRVFELRIISSFSRVVEWELTPSTQEVLTALQQQLAQEA